MAIIAVLVVAGAAAILIISSLGSGATRTADRTASQRTGAAAQTGTTTGATRTGTTASGPVRIAKLSLTLREPSSPAIANGHAASGAPLRVLPTIVRYPVPPSGSGAPSGGPFPLVVFSQGFDESAGSYGGLLSAWARAGYVVASPTYPFTDPASRAELNESDIVNHPADLRFVIASLTRMAGNPASPLHGLIDASRVAVAGQSDGGDVSLAVAANSCCRDGAVRAAVILSGAELASFGGTYYTSGSVPLMVTQGSLDTINPPGCSAQLYDSAPQPKYYLDISGAEHLPPYVSPGRVRSGVEHATIAFLDAYLKHTHSGTAPLGSVVRLPVQETLTSSASAPQPPSAYCPGAP